MAAAGVALAGILVALLVVRRADLDVATDVIEETPALEAA
jgi:hypothetical protein